jgi:uncharacterized protein YjbI with pentapeptide repeats
LSWANFADADLTGSNLEFSVLFRTNFQDAVLDGTGLYGADLRGANMTGASFRNSRLQGVVLRYAQGFTQEQLDQACLDYRTRLPKDIKLPPPCPASDGAK